DRQRDGLVVTRPLPIAVVMALWGRKEKLRIGDVVAAGNVELRRHAAVARVTPIGLPARFQGNFQRAVKASLGVGLSCGDQPHAPALAIHPFRGGSESS